jgi:hypothetical protein
MIINKKVNLHKYRLVHPKTGEVHPAEDITLDPIEVTFQVLDQAKAVFAVFKGVPRPLPLLNGPAFEQFQKDGSPEDKLEEMVTKFLGDDPQAVLQRLMPRTLDSDPDGPGTILSGMLSAMGINSTPNCSCRARAIRMNTEGPDWCENNLQTILDWLREEAKKRKLPFVESGAKLMVQKAISKSRRLLAKNK